VVLVFLGLADQDPAVAVQPRVTRLDDPAACPPPGDECLVGDLLAASADVRRQPIAGQQLADFGVVVGPVQAQALRSLAFRFRAF
jgi:hypothetical protein